jgi:hypothetical protein
MAAAKLMLRIRRLAAVVVLLAACTEEERTPLDYTEAVEQSSTSIADTATAPQPIIPDPQDTPVVPQPVLKAALNVVLQSFAQPPLTGTARLKPNGNWTIVSIDLRTANGSGNYEGAVRQGACTAPGPTVTGLNPVSTDSLGKGASATFIDVPLDTLVAKPHIVIFGKGGRRESCGPIS